MAYVEYEDLVPAKVNYRIIPKLRKYYRADGTFDLFDISKQQICCFEFLKNKGDFGLAMGYGEQLSSFGTVFTNYGPRDRLDNYSTLMYMDFFSISRQSYGARIGQDLRLKLNNKAGYYPYYVFTYNYGDHNEGNGGIYLGNSSSGEVPILGGSGNRTLYYVMNFDVPSTLLDYKDYEYVRLHGYAYDTSKFVRADVRLQVYGIHKFSDDHPLHRYYR